MSATMFSTNKALARDNSGTPTDLGVLRILTCGSVDDGKSTLLGRLLFDSKAILADTLQGLERSSRKRGQETIDLSLLTDGLQAEREQGITIDVAYRYFSTGRRSFILADAPGHEQYTRNMVTGASTADAAVLLVDARKGIQTQTLRHASIAHLLRIPHLIVAVNKLDLVGYDENAYVKIKEVALENFKQLNIPAPTFIPISALKGDLVVTHGNHLNWYEGPPLLELLEKLPADHGLHQEPLRFPVQWVQRPKDRKRAYLGRVESGELSVGDPVVVLPSGNQSKVSGIRILNTELQTAIAAQSIAVELEDELDISRGDLIARLGKAPRGIRETPADLCWLSQTPLSLHKTYLLRSGPRAIRASIGAVHQRLDIQTFHHAPSSSLALNDLGLVDLRLQQPLFADAYTENRATGSFVLVDESTNHTVAAGMIRAVEP
jgi:sulfate adenylyltransferase subunit 1